MCFLGILGIIFGCLALNTALHSVLYITTDEGHSLVTETFGVLYFSDWCQHKQHEVLYLSDTKLIFKSVSSVKNDL